jgi:hypothetical protein
MKSATAHRVPRAAGLVAIACAAALPFLSWGRTAEP